MKKYKKNEFWYKVYLVLLYLLILVPIVLSTFILAGWVVGKVNRKHIKTYITKIEARKAKYLDSKMELVNKLNKYENKLTRTDNENKVNKIEKKITNLKNKISNIDLILVDTQTQIDTPPAEKPENKLTQKIDDIVKDNTI